MPKTKQNSKSGFSASALIFTLFFTVLIGVGGFLVYQNRQKIADYYLGYAYEPTADMSEIRSALNLTKDGLRIFNASTPVLSNRDEFNERCESYNPSVAIYGCYNTGKIYIYNVKIDELPGFLESTTAHEFLHANWERLSDKEKSTLVPLLKTTYEANKAELEESVKNYPDTQLVDELYVREAVQLHTLPEELEQHYSAVFTDRQAIVAFYDSYITPFNKINAEIAAQKTELDHLKTEIESKTKDYDIRSTTFSGSVANFNACAATVGCYKSESVFNQERAALVAEQNSLNSLYEELQDLITSYNNKVAAYNSNVLLSNTLQAKTNSNAPPAAELEETEL